MLYRLSADHERELLTAAGLRPWQQARLEALRGRVAAGTVSEITLDYKRLLFQRILFQAGIYLADGGPASARLRRMAA